MDSRRIFPLSVMLLLLFISSVFSAKLHIGIDYRMIGTHFSDYSSYYHDSFGYSTINTWESYKLLGIKGDFYFWNKRISNAVSLELGAGLGLYFLNSYHWEVGSYTGSGGSGLCFGLDIPARFAFPFSPGLTGFAGTGLSMFFVNGSQPDDGPPGTWGQWFYDESFSESLTDLYLGLGADFSMSRTMVISLGFRFTLLNFGASTDYGMNPSNEGFSNKALTAQMIYRIGR